MLLLFAVIFTVAVNFSILFFLTFPGDKEQNSSSMQRTLRPSYLITEQNSSSMQRTLRPFYLITIAIIFWSMTYPTLLAPDTTTTLIPAYTMTANSVTNGNTLFTFSTFNVITQNNYPLATQSFYAFLPIYIAVLALHLVILIMYLLQWMADTVEMNIGSPG